MIIGYAELTVRGKLMVIRAKQKSYLYQIIFIITKMWQKYEKFLYYHTNIHIFFIHATYTTA